MTKSLRNERGGTLLLYTLSMVVMMGSAALAIDLGMLRKAKAEAQRAADASALAGASAIVQLDLPRAQEESAAVFRARMAVDTNYMNGQKFDSTTEITVQVIWDSVKVRTTVRRASVPTWFARIFGLNSFPVGAKAAAVADNASGTVCTKPLAIADIWHETHDDGDNLPEPPEDWSTFDPADGDFYHPAHYAGPGTGTGLGSNARDPVDRDWGMRIMLKPAGAADEDDVCVGTGGIQQGGKCFQPSWWGLWEATEDPGASEIAAAFESCVPDHSLGVMETTEPGVKPSMGQIGRAIEALYNDDATAYWNPNLRDPQTLKMGTVAGSGYGADWRASKRMWIVAVFSPENLPPKGRKDVAFNNFFEFFFEGCTLVDNPTPSDLSGTCTNKTTMYGRFLGPAMGSSTGGTTPGTMVRILRLVE